MQDNMGEFQSILSEGQSPRRCKWKKVSDDPGCEVKDFAELSDHVATLNFHNPGLNLFFRGQTKNFSGVDRHDRELKTSLLPSAYRKEISPTKEGSQRYFDRLSKMTDEARCRLKKKYTRRKGELDEFKQVTWAVLQHYGCETPLLDITQSLHVASCFATYDYDDEKPSTEGYVYVLGLPNINGHISFFAHEGMVMVKLQAACPPQAKRPHYQQGFLVGSIPSNAKPYSYHLRNLVLRLVAKFRIRESCSFWNAGYSRLPQEVLMPTDEVEKVVQEIKKQYAGG